MIFGASPFVLAGTVTKISEDKVVVDFSGETIPKISDKVVILDQSSHQEVGVISIIKTKDSRALGKLVHGTAKPGDATDLMAKSKHDDARIPADQGSERNNFESIPSGRKRKRIVRKSMYYGVGADFVYTYVTLKTSGNSGSLDGNGFGLSGVIDYSINPNWILQGRVGWHPFNMQSTADSPTVTSIKSTYLALGAIARYSFDNSINNGIWLGGGLNYLIPMSSNVSPKTNEITFVASAGYNMKLGLNYFTIKGDYLMFQPKSSSGVSYQSSQFVLGGIYFF